MTIPPNTYRTLNNVLLKKSLNAEPENEPMTFWSVGNDISFHGDTLHLAYSGVI